MKRIKGIKKFSALLFEFFVFSVFRGVNGKTYDLRLLTYN
jgi:hypothetical protein